MVVHDERKIVIEGNLVRVQRTYVEREVKTSDFLDEIAKLHPLSTGVLPEGCVMLERRSKGAKTTLVFVIEQPARLQPVRFQREKGNDGSDLDLILSWPNTVWFLKCGDETILDVYLTVTRQRLAMDGRETLLFQHLMPNLYDGGDGAMCLGNLITGEFKTQAARINDLLHQVLTSLWNTDLLPDYQDTNIVDLEDWSKKSASAADFHTQILFPTHKRETVGGMLDFLLET